MGIPGRQPASVQTSSTRDRPLAGVELRRLIGPIACVLALATGAWIGQAYALLASSDPMNEIDTPSGRAAETAWRFYDAIDLYFRVGDDTEVRKVLSPQLIDHVETSGPDADREGFLRYLAGLRESHPALRLAPSDVFSQHDRAVARLALDGTDSGAILGVPLSGRAPWPEIEIVRIERDQVVERWGSDVGYGMADPLFAEELTVSTQGEKLSYLRRVTFAPGGNDSALDRMPPAIVFVETGELEADISGRGARSTPGVIRTLRPGSTIVIDGGTTVRLTNRTEAPAVVLLLSLGQPSGPPISPVAGRVATPDSGVSEQELASSGTLPVARSDSKVMAELARVTLAPGTQIAPHAIGGIEIAVVEEGELTMADSGSPSAVWLRDPSGHTVIPGPYAAVGQGHSLTISRLPTAEVEVRTSYRNDGDLPVTFLFVRLQTG
jgi:predicted ester cyclase